jgi:hypothetical protein|tara:strand:+ start:399 stop:701 length:303 start_codon:yes stop_codon:yes gene_type:complete
MAHMITVNTQEDFEDMMKNNNFEISSAITKVILKNLKGKRKNIPILAIKVLEEQTVYDITVQRGDMLESLEKNLEIHVVNEDYESCSKILEAINYLKKPK